MSPPPLSATADRAWLADRQVDLVTGDVIRGGETIGRLTTKERDLLRYLVSRAGEEVPRVDLLTDVWGYAPTARTRAVDFTVRRLRQKIEADPTDPSHVCTVHGLGYRLDLVEAPSAPVAVSTQALRWEPVQAPSEPVDASVITSVQRVYEAGGRLVTVVTPATELGRRVALAVAATEPDGAVVVEGGVAELCEQIGLDADDGAGLCRALRGSTPPLVVLLGVDPSELAGVHLIARVLRAVPQAKFLLVAPRRLALSAEHALAVEPEEPTAGSDLADLDATWAASPEDLRRSWCDLAACTGSVDLEGAEALLGESAVDSLDALQDAGLLSLHDGPEGLRFRLRPMASRYGRQRLGQPFAARQQARRQWVLERYAGVVQGLGRRAPRELAGDAEELVELWQDDGAGPAAKARAAVLLAVLGGSAAADLARLDAVRPDAVSGALRATWLLLRAELRLQVGRTALALEDARTAIEACHDLGLATGMAAGGVVLALALARTGRVIEAREAAERAHSVVGTVDDRATGLAALHVLGLMLNELGERAEAESVLRDAVHQTRLAGDPVAHARAQISLGTLLRHRRQLSGCRDCFAFAEASLGGLTGADVVGAQARLSLERAVLDLEEGAAEQALSVLEPLAGLMQDQGRLRDAGEAWLAVAGSRWQAADLDGAVEGFERARALFALVEDRLYGGLAVAWSGATAAALGELELAEGWLAEARTQLEPLGLRRGNEVLRACRLHLDKARGQSIVDSEAWMRSVYDAPDAWGDVRLALRLLDASVEGP